MCSRYVVGRSMNSNGLEIVELNIPGVHEVRLSPIADERGFFMRTYDVAAMTEAGLHREWVQENESRNERKGVLRGLHFQFPPSAEAKLVWCVQGEVFDVYVDLRRGSPTLGRWGGVVLSEQERNMVFIPKGFAHGYCTLSEVSQVLYKVDSRYDRPSEGGVLWSDPDIGIDWRLSGPPLLSGKDRGAMTFREFIEKHGGLDITLPSRSA
jgi:dTDP-4-dehydrorhamnose 3,5-epimerase